MTSIQQANAEIAARWSQRVELEGSWRKSSSQAGGLGDIATGEAGGFFVELDFEPGRRAYLKPLKRHHWARAAREKIAFDLAFAIGATVPPVLLATNDRSDAKEPNVCVSLVMFPHQFSWGKMRGLLGQDDALAKALVPAVMRSVATAFVLDTWLAQTDHNDHPSNVVYGYEGQSYSEGRLVFLDFAFSMGVSGGWENDGYLVCQPSGFPNWLLERTENAHLEAAIGAVEQVDATYVRDVVGRIPERYLSQDEKTLIAEALVARRSLVRSACAPYLTRQGD